MPADECDEDAALEGDGESVALVALGLLVLVAGSVVVFARLLEERTACGRCTRCRRCGIPSRTRLFLVEKPRESPRLGALRSFWLSETRR